MPYHIKKNTIDFLILQMLFPIVSWGKLGTVIFADYGRYKI